jgi:hypothetical protein
VLLLIAASTISLAFESPLDEPKSYKLRVLAKIDYFMTACFTLEMVLKILTFGFAFNGSDSYLRSGWNIIDFIVILSALISLIPNDNTASFKALKLLRTFRVLRPLRMVQRHKGLKVAIIALFKSLPQIANLSLIYYFLMFLFGILYKTLFGGMFKHCSFEHLRKNGSISDQQIRVVIETKWDCINYGGEWMNSDLKFDNIWESLIALYEVNTRIYDITDIDKEPHRMAKPYFILLGILVDVIVNLLFMNLFISIVYETFKGEKNKLHYSKMLERAKIDWINLQIMGYSTRPEVLIAPNPN